MTEAPPRSNLSPESSKWVEWANRNILSLLSRSTEINQTAMRAANAVSSAQDTSVVQQTHLETINEGLLDTQAQVDSVEAIAIDAYEQTTIEPATPRQIDGMGGWILADGTEVSFDDFELLTPEEQEDAEYIPARPVNSVWDVKMDGSQLQDERWIWDGDTWTQYLIGNDVLDPDIIGNAYNYIANLAGSIVQVGPTTPASPNKGTLWWQTDSSGVRFKGLWHYDGTAWQSYTLAANDIVAANSITAPLLAAGSVTANHITASEALSAKVAEFLKLKTSSLVWDTAAGNNAWITNLVGTNAFFDQMMARQIVVSPNNLIPGVDTIGQSNAGWSAFGRNTTDPSYWLRGGKTSYTDGIIPVVEGVEYAFSVKVKTNVPNSRFYIQMADYSTGSGWTGTNGILYLVNNAVAYSTFKEYTGSWTAPATGTAKLRIYAQHPNGAIDENGYQWFKDAKLVPKVGSVLIENGALDAFQITSPLIQSVATADRGIKWAGGVITGYTNTGVVGFKLDAGLATINGGSITGGVITQVNTDNKGDLTLQNGQLWSRRFQTAGDPSQIMSELTLSRDVADGLFMGDYTDGITSSRLTNTSLEFYRGVLGEWSSFNRSQLQIVGSDNSEVTVGHAGLSIYPADPQTTPPIIISQEGIGRVIYQQGTQLLTWTNLFTSLLKLNDTNWASVSIPGGSGICQWKKASGVIYLQFDITYTTSLGAGAALAPGFTLPVAALPPGNWPITVMAHGSYPAVGYIEAATGSSAIRNTGTAARTRFIGSGQWPANS